MPSVQEQHVQVNPQKGTLLDVRRHAKRVPPEEEGVHERLLALRHQLARMRKDGLVTLEELEAFSADVGRAIADLREVREGEDGEAVKNHVDDTLDDVWTGLFSLWASIAEVDQMLYPVLVKFIAIKRQLDAYLASGAFTEDDVLEVQEALTDIENRHVRDGKFFFNPAKYPDPGNPPAGQSLLFALLTRCRREARNLLLETDAVQSPPLRAVLAELVQVERDVRDIQKRGSYSVEQVHALQEKAAAIDSRRVDGAFRDADGSIPAGQARVVAVLERVFDDLHDLLAAKEEVSGPLRPIFERLVEIKVDLEKLMRNKRWTATYADLDPLRESLRAIDELRSPDGKITKDDGKGHSEVPGGQAAVHQLLARCYHLVGVLARNSEAVAPDLEGLYVKLVETRTALLELAKRVRAGKAADPAAVAAHQDALREIESHRGPDGAFHVQRLDQRSGRVPRGQAVLAALTSECYDLLEEVRVGA